MSGAADPDQYAAWNGESGDRWVLSADRRDAVLGPIADVVLAAAAIRSDDSVLDVGCGCGATTFAAARASGSGNVTGLDLSGPMLDVARGRAEAAGASGVTFVHGDAQTHPIEPSSFDVAISRFGTMFFADPVAAFANVASGVRPGGRLVIATWQPFDANEWLVAPGAALLAHAAAGTDGGAGTTPSVMFAQSRAHVIVDVLSAAGWIDVVPVAHTIPMTVGATVDDAVAYLADTGPGRAALEAVPADRRSDALADVASTLEAHVVDGAGVVLGAGIWVTTAAR